eukprot:CAMPEP_0115252850 /NCGR_PEP_ID=MMETSP0270-20121206/44363_1 /TAXON_ID=71861 /ORGANISM="Scrippsiella trochoidea, Strain CCMP3099" /LENGTH=445 /DNA_ID=CAMNT_0002668325 /DNA_START=158 /DNA_END=1494 /DNA_ORIENTATION=-
MTELGKKTLHIRSASLTAFAFPGGHALWLQPMTRMLQLKEKCGCSFASLNYCRIALSPCMPRSDLMPTNAVALFEGTMLSLSGAVLHGDVPSDAAMCRNTLDHPSMLQDACKALLVKQFAYDRARLELRQMVSQQVPAKLGTMGLLHIGPQLRKDRLLQALVVFDHHRKLEGKEVVHDADNGSARGDVGIHLASEALNEPSQASRLPLHGRTRLLTDVCCKWQKRQRASALQPVGVFTKAQGRQRPCSCSAEPSDHTSPRSSSHGWSRGPKWSSKWNSRSLSSPDIGDSPLLAAAVLKLCVSDAVGERGEHGGRVLPGRFPSSMAAPRWAETSGVGGGDSSVSSLLSASPNTPTGKVGAEIWRRMTLKPKALLESGGKTSRNVFLVVRKGFVHNLWQRAVAWLRAPQHSHLPMAGAPPKAMLENSMVPADCSRACEAEAGAAGDE